MADEVITGVDNQSTETSSVESSNSNLGEPGITDSTSGQSTDLNSQVEGERTELNKSTEPSKSTDKADWKWKQMRNQHKADKKEISRKDKQIAELQRQLDELRNANSGKVGVDLIKGINQEGRLEEKIETLTNEFEEERKVESKNRLDKLASEVYNGGELETYNREIAPRVQATLNDLNSISPIVTRYIATSRKLPLFMSEIADMVKNGEDVVSYIQGIESQAYNVYTQSSDPQIAFELCREWERELVDRHSNQTPMEVKQEVKPKPVAPTTSSVNSPNRTNSTPSKEEIRKLFG